MVIAGGVIAPGVGAEYALKRGAFQSIGRWSYSINDWHYPILILVAQRFGPGPVPENLLLVGVAIALSAATYALVENPIGDPRSLQDHLGDPRVRSNYRHGRGRAHHLDLKGFDRLSRKLGQSKAVVSAVIGLEQFMSGGGVSCVAPNRRLTCSSPPAFTQNRFRGSSDQCRICESLNAWGGHLRGRDLGWTGAALTARASKKPNDVR